MLNTKCISIFTIYIKYKVHEDSACVYTNTETKLFKLCLRECKDVPMTISYIIINQCNKFHHSITDRCSTTYRLYHLMYLDLTVTIFVFTCIKLVSIDNVITCTCTIFISKFFNWDIHSWTKIEKESKVMSTYSWTMTFHKAKEKAKLQTKK